MVFADLAGESPESAEGAISEDCHSAQGKGFSTRLEAGSVPHSAAHDSRSSVSELVLVY